MISIGCNNFVGNNYFSKHLQCFEPYKKFLAITEIIDNNKFNKLILIDPYFLSKKEENNNSIVNLLKLIQERKIFDNIKIYTTKGIINVIEDLNKSDKSLIDKITIILYPQSKCNSSQLKLHARYLIGITNQEDYKVYLLDNGIDSLTSYNLSLDICEQTDILNCKKTIENIIYNKGNKTIFKDGKLC